MADLCQAEGEPLATLRKDIPAGDVRVVDLLDTYPFVDDVIIKEMSGDQIRRALEQSLTFERGLLQLSGCPSVAGNWMSHQRLINRAGNHFDVESLLCEFPKLLTRLAPETTVGPSILGTSCRRPFSRAAIMAIRPGSGCLVVWSCSGVIQKYVLESGNPSHLKIDFKTLGPEGSQLN